MLISRARMRVDYLHTGGPDGEAVDTRCRRLVEGEWAGSRTQLIDTTNLGNYFFEVIDLASNRVIYSRGFATIYGEWETRPEFRTTNRTFHESLRFPRPDVPVRIVAQESATSRMCFSRSGRPTSTRDGGARRDRRSTSSSAVDCCSRTARRAVKSTSCSSATAIRIEAGRDISRRAPRGSWTHCSRSSRSSRAAEISTSGRCMCPASPLSVEFNIFGLERYALTYDNRALRNFAAAAPYDIVEVLRERDEVRRRRHLQSAVDGRRRERIGRIRLHPRACAQPRGARRRVCRLRHLRNRSGRRKSSRGNRTSRRSTILRRLKWRDLVEPGHSGAHAAVLRGQGRCLRGRRLRSARSVPARSRHASWAARKSSRFCRVCQRAIQSHHRSAREVSAFFPSAICHLRDAQEIS